MWRGGWGGGGWLLRTERRVVGEVVLPDLEEASVRREQAQARLQLVVGERVQHDVDAAAARRAQHRALERRRVARVRQVALVELREARQQVVAFGARPDRREHLAAGLQRDGDRRLADAAAARVDEHAVAAPHAAAHHQRVVGGRVDDRDGRRLRQAPGGRHRPHEAPVGVDARRQALRRSGERSFVLAKEHTIR